MENENKKKKIILGIIITCIFILATIILIDFLLKNYNHSCDICGPSDDSVRCHTDEQTGKTICQKVE